MPAQKNLHPRPCLQQPAPFLPLQNNLRLFVDGKLRVGGRPDADSHSNTYAQQPSVQQPEQQQAQQPGKGGKDLSSGGSSQALQAVAEVLRPILDLPVPKEGVAGGPGAGAGQAEPGEREVAHLIALVCGALKCEGVWTGVGAVEWGSGSRLVSAARLACLAASLNWLVNMPPVAIGAPLSALQLSTHAIALSLILPRHNTNILF